MIRTTMGWDLSTVATGVCAAGVCDTLTPPKGVHRLVWLRDSFATLLDEHRPARVVVERPFISTSHSTLPLAELHGVFREACLRRNLVATYVPPTTLKHRATGKGNATKDDMIGRARELGYSVANDNEADAALLYHGVTAGWWDQ